MSGRAGLHTHPRRRALSSADLYIGAIFAAWVVAVTLSAGKLTGGDLLRLLPVAVLTAVVRRFNLGIYATRTYVSLSMAGNLAAGVLFGPAGAVLCCTIAMLSGYRRGSNPRHLLFNLGQVSLANGLAATLVLAAGKQAPGVAVVMLVAAMLAGLATAAFEGIFVSIIVALTEGRSPKKVWDENFRWSLPHWAGLGLVAYGLALAYDTAGLVGLAAFAAPVLLMRYVMKQYLDHTAQSVAELQARNDALEIANHEISAMTQQLSETYTGTLEALVAALDARDRETSGHSVRVSRMTAMLAEHMGVPPDSIEMITIERGSLLHDIGKIGVPDAILRKPGKLLDHEWVEMRRHTRIGYEMLKDIPFLAGAAEIVAAHHERWDGKGYPNGLLETQIPFGARIFMLADTFDAMASDRPYRRAMPYEMIWQELERCAGTQFDPQAVAALHEIFPRWVAYHRDFIQQLGVQQTGPAADAA